MKVAVVLLVFPLIGLAQATVGGCPIFPASNIWNTPVDTLPVHANSATLINSIGATAILRLDDYIPINVTPAGTPMVPVSTTNIESDLGPWPMPANPLLEPGSDSHLLVIDQGTCILYEAFFAVKAADGSWTAKSIAKWDLRSNALRPAGWTSADAAGHPMTAGILKYDEVESGEVKHALRVTAPVTYRFVYTWPARHYASSSNDTTVPKMGQRLRLKANFDISGFSPRNQVILRGLKKYGMMVSDNGMSWGMQHDQDPRWNAAELLELHTIPGSAIEAVDATVLMSDVDSGLAIIPPPQGVFMTDLLGRKNSVPLGPGLSIVNGVLMAGGSFAVTSVAGRVGAVTLGTGDIGGLDTALATLDTKVNNLGTGLTGLSNTVTGLGTTVAAVDTRVNGLNTTVTNVGASVTVLDNKLTALDTKVTGLNTTVTGLNTTVTGINSELASVNNALAQKENILTFSAPLARTANAVSCPSCQISSTPVRSGTATFLSADSTTSGSWKGIYGAGGYVIVGDTTKMPVYAALTPAGNQTTTWANSTSDARALQKAGNGRVAAAWYTPTGMTIEVNIADGQPHKMSLYFLDWEQFARKEQVTITDVQGEVLDTRPVSNFGNGQYLSWSISGRVIIRLTNSSANTAVVSGIFFE